MFERLKALDAATLKTSMDDYLTGPEIEALLNRRDEIVTVIEKAGPVGLFDRQTRRLELRFAGSVALAHCRLGRCRGLYAAGRARVPKAASRSERRGNLQARSAEPTPAPPPPVRARPSTRR